MSYLSEPLQGQGLSVSFRSMMCPALQLLIGTESFGLAGLDSPGEAYVRDIRDCGVLMSADCSCVRREDAAVAWCLQGGTHDRLRGTR